MPANGRFGGHIVAGHVDGVGHIANIRRDDTAVWYTVHAGPEILRYVVEKGSITIDGINVTGECEHKRAAYIGRVFQDPMLGTAPNMQIEENLALAMRRGRRRGLRWGVTKAEREQYRELLKTLDLGLENRLTARVGLLSGGQRQRLTIARAVVKKPEFLILDEHTAALDPKTAELIMQLTDKIVKEKNLTTVMVTHNLRYAVEYGNRLIMMHQGNAIIDKAGEEKAKMKVDDILETFNRISIECGN